MNIINVFKEKLRIFLCIFFLILILVGYGLIVKAYTTHEEAFEVMLSTVSKPELQYLSFIATIVFAIALGINYLASKVYLVFGVPQQFEYILALIGIILIITSLRLSFISFDSQFSYSKYLVFSLWTLSANLKFLANVFLKQYQNS